MMPHGDEKCQLRGPIVFVASFTCRVRVAGENGGEWDVVVTNASAIRN